MFLSIFIVLFINIFISYCSSFCLATKESAFIQGLSSAAITHTITKACSSGNMTMCSCDKLSARRKKREEANVEPWPYDWEWGGCSDNIKHGVKFSKQFVDAPINEMHKSVMDTNSMITLHNTKTGRRVSIRLARVFWRAFISVWVVCVLISSKVRLSLSNLACACSKDIIKY